MSRGREGKYFIEIQKRIITKGKSFENQIVVRVLNALLPNISTSVFLLDTRKSVSEEQRVYWKKKGVRDLAIVSRKIIQDFLLRKNVSEVEDVVLRHDGEILPFKQLQKLLLLDRPDKRPLTQFDRATLKKLENINISGITVDSLYSKVERVVAAVIKSDNAASIDNLLSEFAKNGNIIKLTMSSGVGGHAYILHRNSSGKYYLISSIDTDAQNKAAIDEVKTEYWYQYLCEQVGSEVDFLTKNKQNYDMGCIFCASYTEELLRTGVAVEDLPDQMPRNIETQMMDIAYLSTRPVYEDDDLEEIKVESFFTQGWSDHDSQITQAMLESNIGENRGNPAALIDNLRNAIEVASVRLLPAPLPMTDVVGLPISRSAAGKHSGPVSGQFDEGDLERALRESQALEDKRILDRASLSQTRSAGVPRRDFVGSVSTPFSPLPKPFPLLSKAPASRVDARPSQREYDRVERKPASEPGIYNDMELYELGDDTKHSSTIRLTSQTHQEKYQHLEIVSKISDNLKSAIHLARVNLFDRGINMEVLDSQKFISHVIGFAQKDNQGVGNAGVGKWIEFLTDKYPDQNNEHYIADMKTDFIVAKELSRQFQIASKNSEVYTGRTENLKQSVEPIGMRLKRIPPELTCEILDKAFGTRQIAGV